MSLKTIFIIILTVLLTVFFMENAETITVNVLFSKIEVSKMVLLPGLALSGLVIGFIMGRSGRSRADRRREQKYADSMPDADHNHLHAPGSSSQGGLSQEDQDYIH